MPLDLETIKATTFYWKSAMCLQFAGLVMSIVGFSVPYLIIITVEVFYIEKKNTPFQIKETDVGLWQYCTADEFDSCKPASHFFQDTNNGHNYLMSSRSMTCIAWILEVVAIALTINTVHPFHHYNETYIKPGFAFLSGLFGLIGVNLFQSEAKKIAENKYFKQESSLTMNKGDVTDGYGFYLFLFGQIAYILSGIIHILEARQSPAKGNFDNPLQTEMGNQLQNTAQWINPPQNYNQQTNPPLNTNQFNNFQHNLNQQTNPQLITNQLNNPPLHFTQQINPPQNTNQLNDQQQNFNHPVNYAPLNTTQPINAPRNTTQPINAPRNTTQPINSPLNTTQPINAPLNTTQPINTSGMVYVMSNTALTTPTSRSAQPQQLQVPTEIGSVSTSSELTDGNQN